MDDLLVVSLNTTLVYGWIFWVHCEEHFKFGSVLVFNQCLAFGMEELERIKRSIKSEFAATIFCSYWSSHQKCSLKISIQQNRKPSFWFSTVQNKISSPYRNSRKRGRDIRSKMFFKICVLKNFSIFTWKHLYQSLFF